MSVHVPRAPPRSGVKKDMNKIHNSKALRHLLFRKVALGAPVVKRLCIISICRRPLIHQPIYLSACML